MSLIFPFTDLLDPDNIYAWFEEILRPGGAVCPRCGRRDELHVHARRRPPMADWPCRACGRVFNLFTGTVFQGTHHSLPRLFSIVRAIAQGVSTNQLSRESGWAYHDLPTIYRNLHLDPQPQESHTRISYHACAEY